MIFTLAEWLFPFYKMSFLPLSKVSGEAKALSQVFMAVRVRVRVGVRWVAIVVPFCQS